MEKKCKPKTDGTLGVGNGVCYITIMLHVNQRYTVTKDYQGQITVYRNGVYIDLTQTEFNKVFEYV